jgi:hypothetical protein
MQDFAFNVNEPTAESLPRGDFSHSRETAWLSGVNVATELSNANAAIAWKIAVNPAPMPTLIAQLPFAKGVD